MRIVVHGQQAFGKAVLEALLERGENVVAVYVRAREAGREGRSAQGGGAGREAAGLSAGLLQEARGVGGVQGAQARPAGDGLRHAVRAGGIPQHPDPRLDPVSSLAAAAPTAAPAPSTGRSSRARRRPGLSIFWPDNGLDTGDVLLQKKTPIGPNDTLGTVYFDRLFPMGVDAMMEVGRSRQSRQGAAHQAGRVEGDLRGPLRPRQRQDRLGQALGADRPPDPRLQPGARRLDHARRQAAQDIRRQAAAGQGPQGHRRQARRDRRGGGRRVHRRLRRRPLQGHPRPARRRQEDRSRRMGEVRRREAGAIFDKPYKLTSCLRRRASTQAKIADDSAKIQPTSQRELRRSPPARG